MAEVNKNGKISLKRLRKLREVLLAGVTSIARKELEDIQRETKASRQAVDQAIRRLGHLESRPHLSNGQPIGSKGWSLVQEFQAEGIPAAEWPKLALCMIQHDHRRTAAAQLIQWIFDISA